MKTGKRNAKGDVWSRIIALSNRAHLTYWLILTCSWLAGRLPTRVSYAIAARIGDLVFYTWRDKRRAAIANMRRVLGPAADERTVVRTARSTYRNYLKYTVDFLRFPLLNTDELSRSVVSVGWEYLDRALEAGKGVIFVGMHFGHWDLAAVTVAMRGYPVHAVADTFQPARLNDLIQQHRIEKGMRIIPMESAARAVLRVLRQNEILGLLVDKPIPGDGVRVNFCGAPIEVPGGAALLALRTGARVLPGYLIRGNDDTFFGAIGPHLEFSPTGDLRRDIEALTQHIVDTWEKVVRRHPDQWYMFRHMWEEASSLPTGPNLTYGHLSGV